ncbi:hypothetical protein HDV05_001689, partial [Chytridiales sp. JEL 0842]
SSLLPEESTTKVVTMASSAASALARLEALVGADVDALADIALIRSALKPPPSITISSTSPKVTSTLIQAILGFDLRPLQSTILSPPAYWDPPMAELQPSPWLLETLSYIDQFVRLRLEASHRLVIDALLLESIRKAPMGLPTKLVLEEKFEVSTDCRLNHQLVSMSAKVDYCLGYDDEENEAQNKLVVMEAKDDAFTERDRLQLLREMGVIFESRRTGGKQHPGVYGVL